jgi:hypothetical protein
MVGFVLQGYMFDGMLPGGARGQAGTSLYIAFK